MRQKKAQSNDAWVYRCLCKGLLTLCFLEMVRCSSQDTNSIVSDVSQTSELGYAPRLGVGVNFSEDKTFSRCIHMPYVDKPSGGFEWRLYTETRVNNREQLNDRLGIDASVSAKGFWGQGGVNARYFKDLEMSEDNFYWLVNARYELTTESIDMFPPLGFGLMQEAKDALKNGGLEKFYAMCGTHFYMSRKLGAHVALLYEFKSYQDRAVEDLKAAGDYSGFGWKVEASFQKFMEAAHRNEVVKVHSTIVGGDKSIDEYPEDPSKLKSILRSIRSQLEDNQKGTVLEWGVQSYDIFPEVYAAKADTQFKSLSDDFRNDGLAYYYGLYHANISRISTLNGLLMQAEGEEPFIGFSEASYQAIQAQIQELQDQNALLKEKAQSCLDGTGDCTTVSLINLAKKAPVPDQDFRGIGQWRLYGMLRKDSGDNVDFLGEYLDKDFYLFYTENKLIETTRGAEVHIDGNSKDTHDAFVVIGNFRQVIDPRTGQPRVNLCIGDYAKVCNLRMIENPTEKLEDGSPGSKIQITVFDDMGFVRDKVNFFMIH